MTTSRIVAALSLSLVAALSATNSAQADPLRNLFRSIGNVQVAVNTAKQYVAPHHGHVQPPAISYPQPKCHKRVCPPPPPVHRCLVYCVYYYDCHYGWRFYGEYRSQWAANSAVQNLQYQGYRAYMQTKYRDGHTGGYPAGPVGYPATAGPVQFGR